MTYVETIHERTWDELIGGTAFPAMTANVTFAQATVATTLKRGTLVAKDTATGKYAAADSTVATAKVGTAILAYSVTLSTTADVVGTVYTSGVFNRERITLVHKGDTLATHEDELRRLGIYLTSLHGQTPDAADSPPEESEDSNEEEADGV